MASRATDVMLPEKGAYRSASGEVRRATCAVGGLANVTGFRLNRRDQAADIQVLSGKGTPIERAGVPVGFRLSVDAIEQLGRALIDLAWDMRRHSSGLSSEDPDEREACRRDLARACTHLPEALRMLGFAGEVTRWRGQGGQPSMSFSVNEWTTAEGDVVAVHVDGNYPRAQANDFDPPYPGPFTVLIMPCDGLGERAEVELADAAELIDFITIGRCGLRPRNPRPGP